MKIAWVTDIHLDFLSRKERAAFYAAVADTNLDGLFITGDISVAQCLTAHLKALSRDLEKPIYFVLGNHDFYGGSIKDVRASLRTQMERHRFLTYLPDAGVVELTPTTALVGCDGWGDSRYGDYARSSVQLGDQLFIEELTGITKSALQCELMRLGDQAADQLRKTLPKACDQYPHIILLTHVPPFREACWYQGQLSNDEWLPFFACQAVGDVLLETMQARSNVRLDVYCGHTHHRGTARILPNLTVHTGAAEHGIPHINSVFDLL